MPRHAARMGRPTLTTLARELGVSAQTVSNVINTPDIVRPETRERVLEAIRRSGYRPSSAARALRTRQAKALGLRLFQRVDDINSALMDRFVHALVGQSQGAGYRVTLITAPGHDDEVRHLAELFDEGAIDGCVLTDTAVDDPRPGQLMDVGWPLVAFGRPWGDMPGAHAWVDVDGAAGTFQSTRHLQLLGHEAIGFVGWGPESGSGQDRRSGWRRAMSGHPHAGTLELETSDGVDAGAAAARLLRDRGATAVVCASDALAVGALGVFPTAQGEAPVIGFDDTPTAQALRFGSVAQPVEAAAARIVHAMVRLLDGAGDPTRFQEVLTPHLVPRRRPIPF